MTLALRARASDGHGLCLCRGAEEALRLKIAYVEKTKTAYLAHWPNEGTLHDERCRFHALVPALSGRTRYTAAAIHGHRATATTRPSGRYQAS